MKTFTFREFTQAMRKNGMRQGRHVLFQYESGVRLNSYRDDDKIESACALGQAFINLEVDPQITNDALMNLIDRGIISSVAGLNDNSNYTCAEIAYYLEHAYADKLDVVINTAHQDYPDVERIS